MNINRGSLTCCECKDRMASALWSAVETLENVKVPDVTWVSFEHRRNTPHEFAYAVAPEICVEMISPSNYLEEQMHKGELYLRAGAWEFWLCDERGAMQFFQRRWSAGTFAPRPGVSGEGRDPGLTQSFLQPTLPTPSLIQIMRE